MFLLMDKNELEKDVVKAHTLCTHNREQLQKVKKCGCFYCLKIFDPKLIEHWLDNEETALCPFCCTDSIIYDNKLYPVEKSFLEKMKEYWF